MTGARENEGYVPQKSEAAKIAIHLRIFPQMVATVPSEVLSYQCAPSLQDALKNIPGVSFSPGDGPRDQVTVCGFTAIADRYIDGFRDDGAIFRTELSDSWEYKADDTSPARALPSKRADGFAREAHGDITPRWSVIASFSHLKSKITKGANKGSEAANVPNWSGCL